MNDEQLTQRMRAASDAIEMSDTAQAQHLEAISAALTTGADTSDDTVVPLSRASRRRRIVASVVAAAVIAPAGLAAASEGSIPGDALYPVKQLSERVIVLFDSDVIARHRIEEIERLEASGRFDPELYDDAREALTELGEGHPLWERLAASSDDYDRQSPPIAQDDDEPSEQAASPTTVTLTLPDGSRATLTIADGELTDISPPAGWTVTELDDDGATMRSDDLEVEVKVRDDGSVDSEIVDRLDDDEPSKAEHDTTVTDDDTSNDRDDDAVRPSSESDDDDDPSEPDGGDHDDSDDSPGEDDSSIDD